MRGEDLGTNTGALTSSFAETLDVSGGGLPVLDHVPQRNRMCRSLTQ